MPRKPNNKPAPKPVDALKHSDTRVNIPTEELRSFVADQEEQPSSLLYPRDPTLDPQLVWRGKDEQDAEDLAVPVVPVYIQEKIHPQALIEDLRAHATRPADQLDLFGDFNGLEFEDQIEFYQHEQHWANRLVLGDSLLVMASLAEKEGLRGQVQMIYLDPPYGIGFGSNWQVSARKRDVKDGKAEDLTRQPEQVRAFRDTWQLGIHSYLAYLRDRLVVARDLLTETGSIFVQIGDENMHLVRCLMDEVFAPDCFVALIAYKTTSGAAQSTAVKRICDYIIWYAKVKETAKFRRLFRAQRGGVAGAGSDLQDYTTLPLHSRGGGSSDPRVFRGKRWTIPHGRHWSHTNEGFERLAVAGRVVEQDSVIRSCVHPEDFPCAEVTAYWDDTGPELSKIYSVQTAPKAIERCLLMTTDPGDLVLDPTCGSGTTAYVAEQWGRRWITVDTSRVALALARTRIMTARYPYYLLADTPEGRAQEAKITGLPAVSGPTNGDVKQGFVYKRVPHITLKSIANNEEIDEIHARWQERLEPVGADLNRLLGKSWEEWEVPREAAEDWPQAAREALAQWWDLRRQRQAEIDASIARRAAVELLYDQPYEDRKRVRVAGPFTVESLSPHRVLATDEDRPATERAADTAPGPGSYETVILENLRAAGVQNTVKQERLKFDLLEPYASPYLQAAGEYTDAAGQTHRVAVCLGPEHGTVGPALIKEAAKEAVKGIGFDTVIVCGFAFDPYVSEETKQYGNLAVLPVRMNPDLSMGADLLKKTGAGNLFMVFGEPDLEIKRVPDGRLVVDLRGVDVYDPTTGELRSHSTDDVLCWFVDTDYNGESFFVRHAYFTGDEDPYEKLKRALKAEIDPAAWASLYSTTSRPFDSPATGKIAVKIINVYGDEVLKVYEV